MNYHTLADFRMEKQKELDELLTQVLAALSKEGLITPEQVMHPFLHDLPLLFRGSIYVWFPAHAASCWEALFLPR